MSSFNTEISDAVGACAFFFTLSMWLAPMKDVFLSPTSIFRSSGVSGPSSSFSYVSATANCFLWVLYFSTRLGGKLPAFLINACGLCLNLSFTVCFWYYVPGDAHTTTNIEIIVFLIICVLAGLSWIFLQADQSISYLAVAVNIAMFYGPLASIRRFMRERNVEGLPLAPLVLQLLSSSLWTGWSFYVGEVALAIPNIFGVVFAFAQLGLWYWLYQQQQLHKVPTLTPVATSDDA